jgi:protein phosphatase
MTAVEKTSPRPLLRKPLDEEIDVYGLTHAGKVRPANQDHFLICSLKKQMQVHLTSLTDVELMPASTQRLAFLAMVADGVGGGLGGEEASRYTLQGIIEYVTHSMHCYYTADATDDQAFVQSLEEAALRCHAAIAERAGGDSARRGMATTLTLWLGVWPRAYVLQVGDSRYYLLRDGELTQISRDQTMAQELISLGVLKRTDRAVAKMSNVLSSAIGGPQTSPVVTGVENGWGHVHLLCSDGLTKHVPDDRIRERLRSMTTAKKVCEDLLQDALDAGGTDNITVIVGRALERGLPA